MYIDIIWQYYVYRYRYNSDILNTFRVFQVQLQRLSSSIMRDEEKKGKRRLNDEKNEEKKNRREVSKLVRKQGLKFGSDQDPYPLYLKVS